VERPDLRRHFLVHSSTSRKKYRFYRSQGQGPDGANIHNLGSGGPDPVQVHDGVYIIYPKFSVWFTYKKGIPLASLIVPLVVTF
jgi:hypothetical protein